MFHFRTGEDLLTICKDHNCLISEVMLQREMLNSEKTSEDLTGEMQRNLAVMCESVNTGLSKDSKSASGLSGGDAFRLNAYAAKSPLLGAAAAKAAAAAMAVVEVNASMGRIVAAPTAGASGVLPGVLLSLCGERNWTDDDIIRGLFTAGAIGCIIANHATIAGADGGCQAETGTAAAMAAAALVELSGGSPGQALEAAAIAIKNILGLVCDPVAGLVECPCVKRNAMGAVNALLGADLALAGIKSNIPFDEVVTAMRTVGTYMRPELKETAQGGLAATPTGRAIATRVLG